MDAPEAGAPRSDALVVFGVTGDLVRKKIFPALYAMARRGALDVPLVGVASSALSIEQLRRRAADSLETSGPIDDPKALKALEKYQSPKEGASHAFQGYPLAASILPRIAQQLSQNRVQ